MIDCNRKKILLREIRSIVSKNKLNRGREFSNYLKGINSFLKDEENVSRLREYLESEPPNITKNMKNYHEKAKNLINPLLPKGYTKEELGYIIGWVANLLR